MRFATTFILLLLTLGLSAQETFTQHLTRAPRAGEGRVVLHQDAEIEALVNGLTSHPSAPRAIPAPRPAAYPDSVADADTSAHITLPVLGRRTRAMGYRVQVYAGGNTRQAKSEAYRMANLVRSMFDDVSVYTKFISPRWTCRVGDFRTYEEAADLLRRMRQTQKFREASIIKSQIIVVY